MWGILQDLDPDAYHDPSDFQRVRCVSDVVEISCELCASFVQHNFVLGFSQCDIFGGVSQKGISAVNDCRSFLKACFPTQLRRGFFSLRRF